MRSPRCSSPIATNELGPSTSHVDAADNPYVVFSVRSTALTPAERSQHYYFYGRFDGTRWYVHPLADAGRALYANEGDYTGLVALHPNDPTRLFISTDTHPAPAGH